MLAMVARKLSTSYSSTSPTEDSSVVSSQAAARDNIQTLDSGKSVSRKKSTSETTMKTTTNRSANSKTEGQSTDVLKGPNELKDLQRQSLSSMKPNDITMTSAVERSLRREHLARGKGLK